MMRHNRFYSPILYNMSRVVAVACSTSTPALVVVFLFQSLQCGSYLQDLLKLSDLFFELPDEILFIINVNCSFVIILAIQVIGYPLLGVISFVFQAIQSSVANLNQEVCAGNFQLSALMRIVSKIFVRMIIFFEYVNLQPIGTIFYYSEIVEWQLFPIRLHEFNEDQHLIK